MGNQPISMGTCLDCSEGKGWSISSARNLDQQSFFFAFCRKILIEPFAEIPCVATNNVVVIRIVTFRSSKDQNPDLLFRNLISSIMDIAINDIQQECSEALGTPQRTARGDASRQLPTRVIRIRVGPAHAAQPRSQAPAILRQWL